MTWTSFHIFFTSDRVFFINKCLIPLIKELSDTNLINSYFYICYSENGPHIRLRLKPNCDANILLVLCEKRVSYFFSIHPSPIDLNRNIEWYPNDSIFPIAYEPEIQRYGGLEGMSIIEDQFKNSSEVVLSYINSNENSYNSLLNTAVKLHLTSAFAFSEGNIEIAVLFFCFLFRYKNEVNHHSFLYFDSNKDYVYSNYFNSQKDVFIEYVQTIWNNLKKEDFFDDKIEGWLKSESTVHNRLAALFNSNKLEIPFLYETFPLWSIYRSTVHMTNNRLSIYAIDEPLIAYMLMQSLKFI